MRSGHPNDGLPRLERVVRPEQATSSFTGAARRRTRRELLGLSLASLTAMVPLAGCVAGVVQEVQAAEPARSAATTLEAASVAPAAPATVLTPAPPGAAPAGRPSGRPNVLLITVDALRADQLGAYGHPFVKTPALDRLAGQGARFTAHMVQEPQTDPSHGSLFSGMYPSSSGMRIHMVDKLPDAIDTLATVFSKAGYATAGLFSYFCLQGQYTNLQRGFDTYRDLTAAIPPPTPEPGQGAQAPKGRADLTTDAAIDQLRAFGSRPFFLWVHYFDCHSPYQLPNASLDRYDPGYTGPIRGDAATVDALRTGQLQPSVADIGRLMSLYQAEITFLDSQISRLFDSVEHLGLGSNTIVSLTADHGESFGEHDLFVEASDFFHPCSLYNVEARVPLILRYPGRIGAGAVIDAPTQTIDLFPTLLEMAGLGVPDQAEGSSMVGLLDGTDDGAQRLAYAAMPDYVFTALSTPGWKLIQNNATNERRLYDRARDPEERINLVASESEIADRLTGQLQDWMKRVKISS